MSTGEWIRSTREARGLGKGALAKKVGVSVGRVTQWENGRG
ncbi:MAG: helix-turn-helix domain-containing protein [Deferrisomatales bacterium]